MSNFNKFLKNGSSLGAFSQEELREEVLRRSTVKNPFPLDVFHPNVKPFIMCLTKNMDIPECFVGLGLLSAYSTAIGTSYAVSTNQQSKIYMATWSAFVGMSSSGKSLALDYILRPLLKIQADFAAEWQEQTRGISAEAREKIKLKTVVYRDSHIPTLLRYALPDNPKGLLKYSDELLEWINGMNQLSKKEGTDEQFWISSWNASPYSAIRSRKDFFNIPRPFVNVAGGIQYKILYKFYQKDRDTTGFVFRMLFAIPEVDRIAEPESNFTIPKEFLDMHEQTLKRLYQGLPVLDSETEPRVCFLMPDAHKAYADWCRRKVRQINDVKDMGSKEIKSGILGKIKEYALRFCGILHIVDRAQDPEYGKDFYTPFRREEPIGLDVMIRALKLAEYFYNSAVIAHEKAAISMNAPPEVMISAALLKRGRNKVDIAEVIYGDRSDASRKRLERDLKKWAAEYPKVIGIREK